MAVSFNGSSDYIDFGNNAPLQVADGAAMSMMCWINFASFTVPTVQEFLGMGFDGGANKTGYFFQTTAANNLLAGSYNGTLQTTSWAYTWTTGTWFHCYGDYDPSVGGGTWRIFSNGIQVASSGSLPGPFLISGRNFVAGAVQSGAITYSSFFNGCMADVALFNGPLTGTEIANLANGSIRPNNVSSKTLWGYWKLDTAAATQTDLSGNGNTGTAVGGAITNTCGTSPPYVSQTLILMGQICA